jgi:hypothetical protein
LKSTTLVVRASLNNPPEIRNWGRINRIIHPVACSKTGSPLLLLAIESLFMPTSKLINLV